MGKIVTCDHPVLQHKLTLIRDANTSTSEFRTFVTETSMLMTYEMAKEFVLLSKPLTTPVAQTTGYRLQNQNIVLVPILRAGLGMVEGILKLLPDARIGHIGMIRDHQTLESNLYVVKLPRNIQDSFVIVADPMLATGGSANNALNVLKQAGCQSIKLMCLIASPEGIQCIKEAHPDVDIYLLGIDEYLDEQGYIIPGLGDAGDRLYGTED